MERVPKIWELKRAELLGDETEEQREARQEAYGLRVGGQEANFPKYCYPIQP